MLHAKTTVSSQTDWVQIQALLFQQQTTLGRSYNLSELHLITCEMSNKNTYLPGLLLGLDEIKFFGKPNLVLQLSV